MSLWSGFKSIRCDLSASCFGPCCYGYPVSMYSPSGTVSPNELFHKLLCSWYFITATMEQMMHIYKLDLSLFLFLLYCTCT